MTAEPRTVARKKPRQTRAQVTVDAILEATAHILVRDGYEGLSTNRVAERAGVSIGSLYQYFPGKESLVGELLDRYTDEIHHMLVSMIAELGNSSPVDCTRALVTAMIDGKLRSPRLAKVLREQIPRVGRMKRYEEELTTMIKLVAAYLDAHAEDVRVEDRELAAFIVVHVVDELTHALVTRRAKVDREAAIDEVTDVALRYLLVDAPDRRKRRS
ncbi:MAG: TetR/AcrR family transcriptional regulator [Sandaracinus sp.]